MGINFYKRDDRDLQFVLKEYLGIDRLLEFEKYNHLSMDEVNMVLDQAQIIAEKELAPTLQDSDREGVGFENNKVTAPASFHRLWKIYQEGGWFALPAGIEDGGMGLPHIVQKAATEFLISANMAFTSYAGLGAEVGGLIKAFGAEKLKKLFLKKMYNGTWGGCMCLTEPDVGSDAHLVSTEAIPDGNYYKIKGSKIFITSGDHDLTENIIHLVIARIQGDPPGAKGVSLFAIPKIWVNEDGSLGDPNDVACIAVEHKLGLNASATCAIAYGENADCWGYLVGRHGEGLAHMFNMVNLSRMAVGLNAVAFGSNIYANVLEYAKQRIQGTPFGLRTFERVSIIKHEDVRRMLMNVKSLVEGMRLLLYYGYYLEDMAEADPNPEQRAFAKAREDLLTPIVKAYCSDRIYDVCRDGIQIMGGYGYTKEYPLEQYLRDCKIASIWDGSNYIQSIDLVGKKLTMDHGKVFMSWIGDIQHFLEKIGSNAEFSLELKLLRESLEAVIHMSMNYGKYFSEGKLALIPLTSTRFLDCCGELAISHLFLDQAMLALKKRAELRPDQPDYQFYTSRVEIARYYVRNFLPNIFARQNIFQIEDTTAVDIPEECL